MTFHEFLGIPMEDKHIVSLCGAGGKTSSMMLLAEESRTHCPTAFFTTTHIWKPEGEHLVSLMPFSVKEARRAWERGDVVFAGASAPDHKYAAPEDAVMEFLCREANAVYIEADGSRCRPMKYPNATEPVIRPENTHTVVITGLSTLHGDPEKVFHRLELARTHMDVPASPVSEETMARVIWAGYGSLDPIVFLNQADTPELLSAGEKVAGILRELGCKRVVCSSLRSFQV